VFRPVAWFRLWLESVRDSYWRGTGTVVRKVHRESLEGDALGTVGFNFAFGTTRVPESWVLVVLDPGGREIYREVDQGVWDAHSVSQSYST
jgi:hypothetical protein